MARGLTEAPEKLYVGLVVIHIKWKHKPDYVTWTWVGPYKTKTTTKGQTQTMPERTVWESPHGGIVYTNWRNEPLHEGRHRIDSVILETVCNWTDTE